LGLCIFPSRDTIAYGIRKSLKDKGRKTTRWLVMGKVAVPAFAGQGFVLNTVNFLEIMVQK
jgi:hypothetical protein